MWIMVGGTNCRCEMGGGESKLKVDNSPQATAKKSGQMTNKNEVGKTRRNNTRKERREKAEWIVLDIGGSDIGTFAF